MINEVLVELKQSAKFSPFFVKRFYERLLMSLKNDNDG